MSYVVLARRWRPQGFGDLIGQEPISRILGNALSQGKVAHAYLFSGPRGVGKTSTARILAKALNCEKGPTPFPCGKCASCTAVTDGSSIDVMEIDGASNNSVNDIRDLRERVKYAPAGGRFKVYIIDEAHMLSDSAFNALLKTLEEPPAHVVFILATTAARKIPATVLSRCQHLPFRRVPIQKIKERLRHISDAEGIRISDAAIDMISRAVEGSMRDSLTILDQVSAFASDIDDTEVKDLLGIADFKALSELSAAIIKGERKRILKIIAELADTGTDFKSFTKDLMNFFRDLLVASVVERPEEILDFSDSEFGVVKEILKKVTEDYLTVLLSEMIKCETDVRFAFSPRVALEMSLVRASFLSVLKPLKEAIEHIESFGSGIKLSSSDGGRVPATECEAKCVPRKNSTGRTLAEGPKVENSSLLIPAPHEPAKAAYPDPVEEPSMDAADEETLGRIEEDRMIMPDDALQESDGFRKPEENVFSEEDVARVRERSESGADFWSAFLRKVEAINHPLASKLAGADGSIDGDTLTVMFSGGSAIHADSVRKNQRVIEEIASGVAQRKMCLKIDSVKKKIPRKKETREKIMSEPLVKEAIELFDGRIIAIREIKNSENGGRDVKKDAR